MEDVKNNCFSIIKENFVRLFDHFESIDYRRIIFNLLFAFIFVVTLTLPDFIFKGLNISKVLFSWPFILRFFGLTFMLSFCRSKIFYFTFLAILFIMENIQFHYMTYFGGSLTVGALSNLLKERNDVFDLGYFRQVWFVFPILFLCYFANVLFFLKTYAKRLKTNIVILLILPFALRHSRIAYFDQKSDNYFNNSSFYSSIYNDNKTFSYYFFRYLRKGYEDINIRFEDYQLVDNGITNTQNIFLIMGESTSRSHMSLYGYYRETTPYLEKLKENTEHFQYVNGISSSICTGTSFALFFNSINEPGNYKETFEKRSADLFRLAKNKGFKTHYISAQELGLLNNIDTKYIDNVITKDNYSIQFAMKQDDALIDFLDKIDLDNGKNFVVINLRTPHSPYDKRYAKRKSEFERYKTSNIITSKEYEVDSYDNAMLYTDYIFGNLIEKIKEKSRGAYYVFLTSDHGELLGKPDNYFGHNHLVLESADVPFIFISSVYTEKLPKFVSHYQIGKMMIKYMGYDLINRNVPDNIGYLHDINIKGNYKFIKYKIENNLLENLGTFFIKDYYNQLDNIVFPSH